MKKIVIFGTGGHSAVVLEAIRQGTEFTPLGFIDDNRVRGEKVCGLEVLGGIEDLGRSLEQLGDIFGLVALGQNSARREVVRRVESTVADLQWGTVVHPGAVVASDVALGRGSVVVAGSVINPGTRLGDHVIINTRSSIDHDNDIQSFASTGPGVTTGGNVVLSTCSHLGIGSTVNHGVVIGEHTIVGGQSFVDRDCRPLSVYYGVPARRIRGREASDAYL